MKTLLKEYRKLLLVVALPYLFVVVASIIRVDYDITAPGDLNEVREVISVETNYDQKGSFNTVSVFTNDRTTLLTYLIAKLNPRLLLRNQSLIFSYRIKKIIVPGLFRKTSVLPTH